MLKLKLLELIDGIVADKYCDVPFKDKLLLPLIFIPLKVELL